MRTTPNEAIGGVRTLLREAIGPELASEQAVFLLRRIMAVLRETDWNEAPFDLLRENAGLCILASEVRAVLGDGQAPEALVRWEAVAAGQGAPGSYAEAVAANLELRAAAADTVATLAGSSCAAAVRGVMVARLLSLHSHLS